MSESRIRTQTRTMIVDFDGDSKRGELSGITAYWLNNWPGTLATVISREWGHYAANAAELEAGRIHKSGYIPVMLGGGHSLTYFTVRRLVQQYGGINLLQFDAHHDRYPVGRLSHYSFAYRLQKHHPVHIDTYGVRYEPDRAVPIRRTSDPSWPWYITVDADVFSPDDVASVMHAVPTFGQDVTPNIILRHCKKRVGHSFIAGADFMEWAPANASQREQEFILQFVSEFVQTIEEINASYQQQNWT